MAHQASATRRLLHFRGPAGPETSYFVQGLGFAVLGLGFVVLRLGFVVLGLGFVVLGLQLPSPHPCRGWAS